MNTGMTVGKRIALGFSITLILLGAVSMFSVFGIRGIVGDAGEVIDGNRLRGVIVQREVDHLNWANKVQNALIRHRDQLDVQMDPAQCALEKWMDTSTTTLLRTLTNEGAVVLSTIEHGSIYYKVRQ